MTTIVWCLRTSALLGLLMLVWDTAEAAEGVAGPAEVFWPMPQWARAEPAEVGMDEAKLAQAREYALTGGGSGYITRHGRLAIAWGDPRAMYDLKSTTKSFGSIALGLAIKDGKLRLEDKAKRHHPTLGVPPDENGQTGWLDEITILHLASQTAGFEKPGGYTKLLFRPGTQWDYSDSGPNWLAECITLAYRRDLDEWMFERVFTPLGIRRSDLTWRKNSYRPATIEGVARREFGAGIHANVDAMARIGYLMLREGQWNGREILTREYARLASRTPPGHEKLPVRLPENHSNAAPHYGLLWWNNADRTLRDVPADAYWSWGLYDSLIVVIPSLDIVVARAGKSWKREKVADHYAVLKPFLVPIAQSVQVRSARVSDPADTTDRRSPAISETFGQTCGSVRRPATAQVRTPATAPSLPLLLCSYAPEAVAACPPSPVIKEILWAPPETILRRAKGSDNWPMTWADDEWLYTAYGDGNGFEPRLNEKLSLGLARVRGNPPEVVADNLRGPVAGTERGRCPRQESQRSADDRRRLVPVGSQCRKRATGLFRRPRRNMDLGRLEVDHQLRLPHVPELRPQLRRSAGRIRLRGLARFGQRLPTSRPDGPGPRAQESPPGTSGLRVLPRA